MNTLFRSLAGALALAAVVALPACDSDGNGGGDITATGTVENNFGRPIEGATVTFTEGSGGVAPAGQANAHGGGITCTTNASGQFSCDGLEPGTYTVTITVPGYPTATFTATVSGDGTVAINVPDISGSGNINALIVNALNGSAVANAAVECRRELSAGTYGGVEFTGTTNASGQLMLGNTFSGNASCTATVAGISLPFGMTITSNTTGTIGAVPPGQAGTYRVVLTWGQNPSDLDSHLTGPIAGSSDRFHVYYGSPSYEGHNLDLDDVTSFGPETITIVPNSVNGVYRYSVHNYSQQGATGATEIYNSPARVDLYGPSGLLRTFTAPAPTASNGGNDADTWRVFEMTVSGSTVTFNPASGTSGLAYVQAASPSDMGTFLTGGFPAKGAAN